MLVINRDCVQCYQDIETICNTYGYIAIILLTCSVRDSIATLNPKPKPVKVWLMDQEGVFYAQIQTRYQCSSRHCRIETLPKTLSCSSCFKAGQTLDTAHGIGYGLTLGGAAAGLPSGDLPCFGRSATWGWLANSSWAARGLSPMSIDSLLLLLAFGASVNELDGLGLSGIAWWPASSSFPAALPCPLEPASLALPCPLAPAALAKQPSQSPHLSTFSYVRYQLH